jgi:predicted TIM-barrel fold metal-dependent hydrolase
MADATHDPDAGLALDEWAPDPAARQRILVENPARLFGFT